MRYPLWCQIQLTTCSLWILNVRVLFLNTFQCWLIWIEVHYPINSFSLWCVHSFTSVADYVHTNVVGSFLGLHLVIIGGQYLSCMGFFESCVQSCVLCVQSLPFFCIEYLRYSLLDSISHLSIIFTLTHYSRTSCYQCFTLCSCYNFFRRWVLWNPYRGRFS